jgi:acetyl esterase/lipase
MADHLAISPNFTNQGVWLDPVPDLVLGEVKQWASIAGVEAVRIPGYWLARSGETIPAGAAPAPGEKVVLALHGGAYIVGSAVPSHPTAEIAKGLVEHLRPVKRVFSVEYRLSAGAPKTPVNPFPAALIDALAGYNYLVNTVGISPADIIVEGDSAGGNLALALARYLVEQRAELAKATTSAGVRALDPPGALMLLSPWCDVGSSHDAPPPPYFARTDIIGNTAGPDAKHAHAAFLGPHGLAAAETNAYISPASKAIAPSFTGFPRTFIACGGVEMLAPSIRTLRERMASDLGEGAQGVTYFEAPDGIHDFVHAPWCEPERTEALVKLAEWVDTLAPPGMLVDI